MLTVEDIQNKEFKKAALGYSAEEVDIFLNDIISDYDKMMKENIELKDKIALIGNNLEHYRTLENSIQRALVLAEKTADETKASAHLKSEQIVREAEIQASLIIQNANDKLQEIEYEILKLKNQYENAKAKIRLLFISELDSLDNMEIFENDSGIIANRKNTNNLN